MNHKFHRSKTPVTAGSCVSIVVQARRYHPQIHVSAPMREMVMAPSTARALAERLIQAADAAERKSLEQSNTRPA